MGRTPCFKKPKINKHMHKETNKRKAILHKVQVLAKPFGCYSLHYLNVRVSAAACLAPRPPVHTHLLPPRALFTQKAIDWANVLLCLCELALLRALQKSPTAELKRGLCRGYATHGSVPSLVRSPESTYWENFLVLC